MENIECQDIGAEASCFAPYRSKSQSQKLISSSSPSPKVIAPKRVSRLVITALFQCMSKSESAMALLSTQSDLSALSSLVSWKTALIVAFALVNRKSLPFAWTVRTQSCFQIFKTLTSSSITSFTKYSATSAATPSN